MNGRLRMVGLEASYAFTLLGKNFDRSSGASKGRALCLDELMLMRKMWCPRIQKMTKTSTVGQASTSAYVGKEMSGVFYSYTHRELGDLGRRISL